MKGNELEKLMKSIVNRVANEYAGFNVDREDLLAQAFLIAVEFSDGYDKNKGASMSTYLYTQVYGRLRNYVHREVLPGDHGPEGMQRVSMELVDQEVSISDDVETKILLNEIAMSLETEEDRTIFSAMRAGYTYREIAKEMKISIGYIAGRVNEWRSMYG